MQFETAAAVRCRPVEVTLAGRTYTIPALPAADWLIVMEDGTWLDIMPGMLVDDGSDELDQAIESGELTHEDLVAAARDALEAVSGTRWWIAMHLINGAIGDSTIAGELVLAGVDLNTVSVGALVQGVYRVCTRHGDKAKVAQLDAQLQQLPEGVSAAEVYDEDAAADAFEAMARRRGVA